MHDRRTDLNAGGSHQHEFNNILPGGNAPDPGNRNTDPTVPGTFCHHAQGNRLHCRAAIAAVRALAADIRNRVPTVDIHACQTVNRIDQADRVRAAFNRMPGDDCNIGNIRGQLYDDRCGRHFLHPGRLRLHQIRLLAGGCAHPALGHAVRTAEVELQPVYTDRFHPLDDLMPLFLLRFYHQGGDNRMIRKSLLRLIDFLQVHFKRTVRNELNVVKASYTLSVKVHCCKPGRGVNDRFTQRLPDRPSPARFKRTLNLITCIGRRRRGQPERIG
ncbi:hypothetical protein D3C74_325830 [compost metagenome]